MRIQTVRESLSEISARLQVSNDLAFAHLAERVGLVRAEELLEAAHRITANYENETMCVDDE